MLTQPIVDLYGHSNALADTKSLELALALRQHVNDPFLGFIQERQRSNSHRRPACVQVLIWSLF